METYLQAHYRRTMKPWEIIKLLESDNSRLFKEEVVAKHSTTNNSLKGYNLHWTL